MTHGKFEETGRSAVIDELGRRLGVQIDRVGHRRKWLRDHSGRNYWVLGGYADWHGIPEKMMDAEVADPSDGFVVIAMRRQFDMEIFLIPSHHLLHLIEATGFIEWSRQVDPR